MLPFGQRNAFVLALLVAAGAVGAAVASTSCFGDEPRQEEARPDRPPAPPTVPEPAEAVTGVRFRCALPDGVGPNARVTAWWRVNPSGVNRLHRVTRDGEHLTVEVPPGPGFVTIHVVGCVVVRHPVNAEAEVVTDSGELALTRCTILRGRVVDESGAPVDGAFLWPKAGDLSVPLESTDENGTFSFDGLPDGKVRLRVESDRFVRRTVVVHNRANAELVEIVLQRGGELRGVVLDVDERPVPDAFVWVLDPHDDENRDRMAWPDVEEDGTFSVRLAPGTYRVGTRAGGRTGSLIVDVKDGKTREVTIVVAP